MNLRAQSRPLGRDFRRRVADYFAMSGVHLETRHVSRFKLSEDLVQGRIDRHAAFQNAPGGWWLGTTDAPSRTLGESLDLANRLAQDDGAQRVALIASRPGYDAGEALVLLPLQTFTKVLLEAQERDRA